MVGSRSKILTISHPRSLERFASMYLSNSRNFPAHMICFTKYTRLLILSTGIGRQKPEVEILKLELQFKIYNKNVLKISFCKKILKYFKI